MAHNTLTESSLEVAAALAKAAKTMEWGSDKQIEAQNTLTAMVERRVNPTVWAKFEAFCNKATTDEICDEAIRLLERVAAAKMASVRRMALEMMDPNWTKR